MQAEPHAEASGQNPLDPLLVSRRRLGVILTLCGFFLLTLWAYSPLLLLPSDFLDLDDGVYVANNEVVKQGLTASGLRFSLGFYAPSGNWHPMTWLSHMLDCHIFGLSARGHHASSVFLHLLNGGLLAVFLLRLTGWPMRSLIIAGLFLLHPLNVESVAWISERKNVLSTTFGLLCLLAYLRYGQTPTLRRYLLVVLLLVLGLASKPMLVTLPCVFLLLDAYPLRRLSLPKTLPTALPYLEKLPLLACSAACSVLTILAQQAGGAVRNLGEHPLGNRVVNMIYAYGFYVWKIFVPTDLHYMYRAPSSVPLGQVLLSLGVLLLLSALFVYLAFFAKDTNRRPFALMGWCWFLGTLVPVIGLVQVGDQFAADRYVYLPGIGFFLAILSLLPADRLLPLVRRLRSPLPWVLLTASALPLGYATSAVAKTWLTSLHLYERMAIADPSSPYAHAGYGDALLQKEHYPAARIALEKAIALRPNYADAHVSLAFCLGKLGQTTDALAHLGSAMIARPKVPGIEGALAAIVDSSPLPSQDKGRALFALALRMQQHGRLPHAFFVLKAAANQSGEDPEIQCALGTLYGMAGNHRQAAFHLQRGAAKRPDDGQCQKNLERAKKFLETKAP